MELKARWKLKKKGGGSEAELEVSFQTLSREKVNLRECAGLRMQ